MIEFLGDLVCDVLEPLAEAEKRAEDRKKRELDARIKRGVDYALKQRDMIKEKPI